MKLKICGMKFKDNIIEVAQLQPDYMGFIFYENSSRYFDSVMLQLPSYIKKVGVFVDATLEDVVKTAITNNLQAIQLHGQEPPKYCDALRSLYNSRSNKNNDNATNTLKIIKVFSIKNEFDFSQLADYELYCDYFLFDTKGKLPGGNGYSFDWKILEAYPSTKPYFLSGGIGLEELNRLKEFQSIEASTYCHAIDVNSKFELDPGLKCTRNLKEFKAFLKQQRKNI